jgi:hypothetical protein
MVAEITGPRKIAYLLRIIDNSAPKYGETLEYAFLLWKEAKIKEAKSIFAPMKESNEKSVKEGNENHNYPYELARIYSVEGVKDKALENLKLAIRYGWKFYLYAKADPLLNNIQNDTRSINILDETKNDIETMSAEIK